MLPRTLALGLGSNLGTSIDNLRLALYKIKQIPFFRVLRVSPIYESDAQLPEKSNDSWNLKYLNAVVLVELLSEVAPLELLNTVKNIELSMGRAPSDRWAPRIIDIDILAWSGEDYFSEKINIPHRELLERPFALLPLLQVWPEYHLRIEKRPHWTSLWIKDKPFNTIVSEQYFWPEFVAILNVTDDSFSDGGKIFNTQNNILNEEYLIKQIERNQFENCFLLDIGAESTRPQAQGVDDQLEWQRLDACLNFLSRNAKQFKISLDCRKPNILRKVAEKYKLDYINDVTGLSSPAMVDIARELQCVVFTMHSLGIPPLLTNTLDESLNPCDLLVSWWKQKLEELVSNGLTTEKLIFDPGIGFGKNKVQNNFILNHLNQMSDIKNSIMIGHSRKSYQSLFSDREASLRDLETALTTVNLNLAYTQYLRVHDVQTQKIALRAEALNVSV